MRFQRSFVSVFLLGMTIGSMGTAAAALRGSAVFRDVQPGSYYDDAIGELYNAGIIKGTSANTFSPDEPITRGQVAVLLYRLRNDLLGNVETPSTRSSSSSSSRSTSSTTSTSTSVSSASRSPAGAFRFTAPTYSVAENGKSVTIGIVRVGGAKGVASVSYAMTAGTATADTDYAPIGGVLDFADGATSKTLTIIINDDSAGEGNETMTMTLSAPTGGAQLDSPSTATLTITDNETGSTTSQGSGGTSSTANAAGTIEFGASVYTVAEDGGTMTVTVNRTGGSTGTVGVNYATSDNTGKAGADYTASNGTLSFAAGETAKTFTVSISDNSSIEGAKKFNLTLSSVTGGASLGTPSAQVTILDDDTNGFTFGSGSLKFSATTYPVREGDDAVLTVMRIGGTKGTVSVSYGTFSTGDASAGDYTSRSGTLTFLPGESSKTIRVPTTKDVASDPGELFSVTLSSPSAGTSLSSPSSANVSIE